MLKTFLTALISVILINGCVDKNPQPPQPVIERPSLRPSHIKEKEETDSLPKIIAKASEVEDTIKNHVNSGEKEKIEVTKKAIKLPKKKVDTITVSPQKTHEPEKDDTIKVDQKPVVKCQISGPANYIDGNPPRTLQDAENWGKWMLKKAICFRVNNMLDSCFYYTNIGIKTYENGSFFALKSWCLNKYNKYSAAKTAADISLSRNDHWERSNVKESFENKIAAIQGMLKEYPSMALQRELETTKSAYNNLYNN